MLPPAAGVTLLSDFTIWLQFLSEVLQQIYNNMWKHSWCEILKVMKKLQYMCSIENLLQDDIKVLHAVKENYM